MINRAMAIINKKWIIVAKQVKTMAFVRVVCWSKGRRYCHDGPATMIRAAFSDVGSRR